MRKVLVVLLAALTVLTGIVPAIAQDGEWATLYGASTSNVSTLDPQVAEDSVSISAIENLFLGLLDYDPYTASPRAELATEWEITGDGTVYTFTLRDDVQWVKYNAETEEFEAQRAVVAGDFEYGIKRACDQAIGSNYSYIVAPLIVGCAEVLTAEDPEAVTEEDVAAIGVSAPDDTTLVITLNEARGYFQSMLPMWTLRAVPAEVVEEYGSDWTQPENIWTNGAFGLVEWTRGVRRVYERNPFYPEDMAGPGNVGRVETNVVEDANTMYALYQDNQLESTAIPRGELQAFLEQYPEEALQTSDLAVFYIAFAYDKEPMSNVHVRRAFSAIMNRDLFVQEVNQGQGLPMTHFAPPGIFGAVPIDEVGIGYDPEFAQAELEAAGYPGCEGLPPINFVVYSGAEAWIEFLLPDFESVLGCDPDLITIEQQEFSVLLQSTDADTPTEERPHGWTLGWGPDYPDQNNWVHDVLHCDANPRMKRPCAEVDDTILAAAAETDPEKRIEMYREVEEAFFGPEGEVPFIPIYLRVGYTGVKPWYNGPFETDGLFGGPHWDYRTIDIEAQMAARGEM